jgi:hypothetical protein
MSNEFGFRSYAHMRKPANDVWTEAIMNYAIYSAITAVVIVILAEVGTLLYHASFLAW